MSTRGAEGWSLWLEEAPDRKLEAAARIVIIYLSFVLCSRRPRGKAWRQAISRAVSVVSPHILLLLVRLEASSLPHHQPSSQQRVSASTELGYSFSYVDEHCSNEQKLC